MERPVICTGPASEDLAKAIAVQTGFPLVNAEARTFPDGEVWTRVPQDLAGRDVVIVQGTHRPQDQNLQHLYQMVEAAQALKPASITCVVPYLAYSRQDRRDNPGEPISSQIVLRTLEMLGASRIISVEMHNPAVASAVRIPVLNLGADRAYVNFLRNEVRPSDPVLVSPDRGSASRIERIAKLTGWPMVVLAKKKTWSDGTWYESLPDGLAGRDAIAIDDLCSSGSTLGPLSDLLTQAGASRQVHLFAHFLGNHNIVRTKVPPSVALYSTDTVSSPIAVIPIAEVLADAIIGEEARLMRAGE